MQIRNKFINDLHFLTALSIHQMQHEKIHNSEIALEKSSSNGIGTTSNREVIDDRRYDGNGLVSCSNNDDGNTPLLAPWTYSCLFRPSIERLKRALGEVCDFIRPKFQFHF